MWAVAGIVFASFAIVAGAKMFYGKASCGCFGRVEVRPVYTMIFDLLVVGGLLTAGRMLKWEERQISEGRRQNEKTRPVRMGVAAAVGIGWLVAVGVMWGTRPAIAETAGQSFGKTGELVVLEPEKWVGQSFALAEHIDVGERMMSGRWTVLLVHYDCEHCADRVNAKCGMQKSESRKSIGQQWAVIEMPPYAEASDPASWTLPPAVLAGRLDQTCDWFASTPAAIHVEDGAVVAARDGDGPH